MKNSENEKSSEWPRKIFICKTSDAIAAELIDDDDDDGLIEEERMESAYDIEIDSWEKIPKGYEPVNEEDRNARDAYLESKYDDR